MHRVAILAAVLLASCSQQDDNELNAELDENVASETAGDVPIPEDGSPATPGVPPNDGAPAQPGAPPNGQTPVPPDQNQVEPAPEPAGPVTLAAAPRRTSAGSTVTLTLSNGSRQAVGYNLCTSALQTRAGRAVDTDRVCTLELRTLNPGQRATYGYELPASLPDGRYRFSTGLDRMPEGGRTTVISNNIAVR